MSLFVNKEVVKRYVNNECTEEENIAVKQWLEDPVNEETFRALMNEQWNDLSRKELTEIPLQHVLKRIHDHMDSVAKKETRIVPIKAEKNIFNLWIRIAATISLIMGVAAILYWQFPASPRSTAANWNEPSADSVRYNDKITSMVLPDGTTVWLNAKSKLKYSPEFSGKQREVYLEGEAFFDVTEDKERPFIVYTQDIRVKVLGTAFTVKAYTDDHISEATLVRGKVIVANGSGIGKANLEMNPDERVVYSRDSKELTLSQVKADDYVLWKSGTLRFENEPLDNVIRSLERWYSVTITVPENQESDCRLTARIESETLEEMLELLKSSTGIDYSIAGDTVSITGKLCI